MIILFLEVLYLTPKEIGAEHKSLNHIVKLFKTYSYINCVFTFKTFSQMRNIFIQTQLNRWPCHWLTHSVSELVILVIYSLNDTMIITEKLRKVNLMTLRVSDFQSDSDLDSIRNSCDVYKYQIQIFFIEYMGSLRHVKS